MAGKRQLKNGMWEYQFQRKGLLERTYRSFDNETEGDAFSTQVEALLDKGIIPIELTGDRLDTIGALLGLYEVREILAPSSSGLIPALRTTIGGLRVGQVSDVWLDSWIEAMQQTLAPSTLKKRVELLGRCIDWAIRKNLLAMARNPIKSLPRGWSTKGMSRAVDWSGQRERRLSVDGAEERAIRSVLAEKGCPAELMLFDMALESAMRLREMYTLTRDQVRFDQDTIFLEKTKNGDKRQVPMSSTIKQRLTEYMKTVEGDVLYPWWDGTLTESYLDALSSRLSHRFSYRFNMVDPTYSFPSSLFLIL